MRKHVFFLLIFLLGCSNLNEDINDNSATYPTRQPTSQQPVSTLQVVSPTIANPNLNLRDVCGKPVNDFQTVNMNYFVFAASWSGSSDIYLTDRSTGLQQRITTNLDSDMYPKLNHSKKQVAFLRYIEDKGELYVKDIPGNGEKLVSPAGISVFPDFFWSPNDQCILFTGQSIQSPEFTDVYLMSLDGIVENLTADETLALGFYASKWNPDGKSVLLSGYLDTRLTIWHMFISDMRSKKIIDLTKNKLGDWSPSWNPREDLIAFIGFSDYVNKGDIFLMEPIDFTQKKIITLENKPLLLEWALDGEKLFYVTVSEDENITTYDVWSWNMLTEETHLIVTLEDNILGVSSVKPDEIVIYVYSDSDENITAYSLDIESGNRIIIAEDINY